MSMTFPRVAMPALDVEPQTATKKKPKSVAAVQLATEIIASLDRQWIPRVYIDLILPSRTRSYHLEIAPRHKEVVIQATLLGVELKVGRRRMLCPDPATARYLAVFARIGCQDIAVPYDISRIGDLASRLEAGWNSMQTQLAERALDRTVAFRSRLRTILIASARREITEAGAGKTIPEFNQNTKQKLSYKR